MIQYCSENSTFLPPWQSHGFTPCFIETLGPSILFALNLIFGSVQLHVYRKHGTALAIKFKPKGWGYRLQMILLCLLLMLILFRLAVQTTVLVNHRPAGYMIVYCATYILALLMSIFLVVLERNFMLPTVSTRGHGLVILAFWALALIFENLSFFNLKSPLWWWKLEA